MILYGHALSSASYRVRIALGLRLTCACAMLAAAADNTALERHRNLGKAFFENPTTHVEAIADLFEYVEVFYNRSRRHSTLGQVSPTQFMQDWIATQQEKNLAA